MEVILSVVATPAPGLEYKRKMAVQKLAGRANNKEEKLTMDTTKVPLDATLYDTIVSWFPAEVQSSLLFVNVKIDNIVIDVNAPPVMKPNSKVVYYVLVK